MNEQGYPALPARIARLDGLSRNLWWAWQPEARALFRRLGLNLWVRSRKNPVAMLHELEQERLDALSGDPLFLREYDAVMAEFEDVMAARRSWYADKYGEPYLDMDGDDTYDPAEKFFDANMNGVRDAGYERGEMWAEVGYDAANQRTIVLLHATPLVTPRLADGRGLDANARLYDLEYIPCPTPSSATGTDRFRRDLYGTNASPKNTARWMKRRANLPGTTL